MRATGLTRGAEVGIIGSGPNYDTDWANIAEIEVTSEIQNSGDEASFVTATADRRQAVLAEFRRSGAEAVFTRDKIVGDLAGWQQLGGAAIWIYRFR